MACESNRTVSAACKDHVTSVFPCVYNVALYRLSLVPNQMRLVPAHAIASRRIASRRGPVLDHIGRTTCWWSAGAGEPAAQKHSQQPVAGPESFFRYIAVGETVHSSFHLFPSPVHLPMLQEPNANSPIGLAVLAFSQEKAVNPGPHYRMVDGKLM